MRPLRRRSAELLTHGFAPVVAATVGVGLLLTGLVLQLKTTAAVPESFGSIPTAAADVGTDEAAGDVRGDPGVGAAAVSPRSGDRLPVRVPPSVLGLPPQTLWLPEHRTPVPVVPVQASRSGELDPPERVSVVGWWRGGAAVGDRTGSLVLVGHVDAAEQGLGAFAALRQIRAGQVVRLRDQDGRLVAYRITGRRAYSRRNPLPANIFAQNGPTRLVMITCTGAFNATTAHYSDSLAVYAVPVTAG